jgi:uncharacterized protein (DUF2235 family)
MSENIACPQTSTPKNIVVFCDGTWNQPDQKTQDNKPCPTNVAKLFEAVCPFDINGNPQLVHYLRGVGTRRMERIKGGGFGYGISDNIKEGYQFICSNYQPGDHIYLFGFSRGAYTARSIAGFIHNMGIIRKPLFYKTNEAFDHYRDKSKEWHPGAQNSIDFQKANGYLDGNGEPSKKIHFLGVWDTVGALGAPYGIVIRWIIDKLFKCTFHDTNLSSSIESAYHAVAMDEKRWPFRPTLWDQEAIDPAIRDNYEQVWFPGVHSDVGGGYPETALSDIPLNWMATKASDRGLCLDLKLVKEPEVSPVPTSINAAANMHNSQTWFYRLATVLFVKLPNALKIPLPDWDKNEAATNPVEIKRIDWNGNYNRAVPDDDKFDITLTGLSQHP